MPIMNGGDKARQHPVLRLRFTVVKRFDQIKFAILEKNGKISIVPQS